MTRTRRFVLQMSTVLVIGASRGIGLETVKCAVNSGHEVRALARSATSIPLSRRNLEKITGDALDFSTIKQALAGNRGRHSDARG